MIFSKKSKVQQNSRTAVSFIGFDRRSEKAFEIFFRTYCKDQYYHTKNHTSSSITIVDMDCYKVEEEIYELHNSHPGRQLIALSLNQKRLDIDNCILVKKPINHTEFAKLLSSINAGKKVSKHAAMEPEKNWTRKPQETKYKPLHRETKPAASKSPTNTANAAHLMGETNENLFVGSNPDIDLQKPREFLKIIYSPDKMFQGALQRGWEKALNQQKLVELIFLSHTVFLDGKNHTASTALNDSVLRPMCLMESEDQVIIRLVDCIPSTEQRNKTEKRIYNYPIDAFIWKVSLWSSRGRILQNTDINKPVFLSEWPNLTRLQPIPHALRIAALLTQNPRPLGDISTELNIPQRYVFGFYSAANALGISGVSKRTADALFEPKTQQAPENRSILKRLLGRLAGQSSETQESSLPHTITHQ